MFLVGNRLNGRWPTELVHGADIEALQQIDLAVAYVSNMDEIFRLATNRRVPLNLYALADGHGFPHLDVAKRFLASTRASWRLFLVRDFYHPKVMWFRGVGAYIGSANLSDKAWFQSHECGVWFSQDDLNRLNWNEELAAIFEAIQERCREITREDLQALQALQRLRSELDRADAAFKEEIDRQLSRIPGTRAPIDVTASSQPGGEARSRFCGEWEQGLTVLRKITRLFAAQRPRWPSWVSQSCHPAIVQDQATEWWWHHEFRVTGESPARMTSAHEANAADPDAAVQGLFDGWLAFRPDLDSSWTHYMNDTPPELHDLLQKDALRALDEERLVRILWLCHSAREHGRQIANRDLGFDPGEERSVDERIRRYGQRLQHWRSAGGRTVRDVLEYVIWGNGRTDPPADRIWAASNDEEWKLPHLGVHIFGELVGYARPDEFPPRNNRVSKTLHALGFAAIRYS
ncbi:MAG: phospholipase D-like domain-containing protein [bacterium]